MHVRICVCVYMTCGCCDCVCAYVRIYINIKRDRVLSHLVFPPNNLKSTKILFFFQKKEKRKTPCVARAHAKKICCSVTPPECGSAKDYIIIYLYMCIYASTRKNKRN